MPLIREMIQNGFTGDKGEGGFYRIENNTNCAVDLINGEIRPRQKNLPISAQKAADAQAVGDETLTIMINGSDNHVTFCKRFLARTLAYAADLIPAVTSSPQDIDDAMKLGFNWVRGPFELIDALGANVVAKLIEEGHCIPFRISFQVCASTLCRSSTLPLLCILYVSTSNLWSNMYLVLISVRDEITCSFTTLPLKYLRLSIE